MAGQNVDESGEAVSVSGHVTSSAPSVSGSLRTKVHFAVQHLLGAARLAREIHDIECEHAGQPLSLFFDDVIGASCGAVMLSVASIESFANEVFSERLRHFPASPEALVKLLWAEYERKSVIDKFELAVRLRSGGELDRGARPVQSLDVLVRLRNAIVHFKPEWFGDAPAHERLSRQMENLAVRSAWLPNEPLFPRAWVSHGSATWAVRTVMDFAQYLSQLSGVPDPYQQFSMRLAI